MLVEDGGRGGLLTGLDEDLHGGSKIKLSLWLIGSRREGEKKGGSDNPRKSVWREKRKRGVKEGTRS